MADKKHKGNNRNKEKVVKSITLDAQENIDKQEFYDEIKKGVNNVLKGYVVPEDTDKILTMAVNDVLKNFDDVLDKIIDNEAYKRLQKNIRTLIDSNDALKKKYDEWLEVRPFLEEEIKKPKYNGRSLDDLSDEEIEEALSAARAAMLAKELPVITVMAESVSKIEYPIDKINASVWGLLKGADKNGQIHFSAERKGSKKAADIIYSINFDELQEAAGVSITKNLTATDKRIYIAAGALYNAGYEVFTVSQLYAAMGNSGRPSAAAIKRLNESLTKIQAAHIYLNNKAEKSLYPNYDEFVYDGNLLPMERVTAMANGQPVESAIHLLREPPLLYFAKQRKQVTTIKRELLESPISKTEANLKIDDYLTQEISHIKAGRRNNKMLYETIFKETDIKTKMQRSRAPEKIKKYLDHYKKCSFIKDYKEDNSGITIYY